MYFKLCSYFLTKFHLGQLIMFMFSDYAPVTAAKFQFLLQGFCFLQHLF